VETKKIIKIRSLTPPTVCESELGPAQEQQEFESNEVRVSLLADVNNDTACPWRIFPKRIFARRSPSPDSANEREQGAVPREQAPPACYYDRTAVRAREALALTFVDEELAPRAIPERIYARKLCSGARKHQQVSSLAFGKLFPAADVASKSRRPNSRGRPQNRGDRRFREPFRPEPVVAQGQGRVDCRGRVPREHSSPRRHPQGQERPERDQVCPLSRCTPSRPVPRFPCIRPIETRGNEDGSGALQQPPPEQEDEKISLFKRISPFDVSMELKFELDTRLTVSCVVAVASAYGLLTVSIALDSILLAFGNAVILLLILFVLFGWKELLGEFHKKRSTAN